LPALAKSDDNLASKVIRRLEVRGSVVDAQE
jgi:hypothetical protein